MADTKPCVGSKRPLPKGGVGGDSGGARPRASKMFRAASQPQQQATTEDLPARIAELFEEHHGASWMPSIRELYPSCPVEKLGAFWRVLNHLAAASGVGGGATQPAVAATAEQRAAATAASLDEAARSLEILLRDQEVLLPATLVSCVFPRASLHLQLTAHTLVLHTPLEKKTGKPVCIQLVPEDLERVLSVTLPNKRQQLLALVLNRVLPETGSDLLLMHVPINDRYPPAPSKVVKGEPEEAEAKQPEELSAEELASTAAAAAASDKFDQWFKGSVLYLRTNPRPLHEALGNWLAHWNTPQRPRPLERHSMSSIKCYQDRI